MDTLLQSAKAVNGYHPFPLINFLWIFLAFVSVALIILLACYVFQTRAITVAQIILAISMTILAVMSIWNLYHPNQVKLAKQIQLKQQQFVQESLKPYITKNTKSITILGYVCGIQGKENVVNMGGNPNQVAITAYYKDSGNIKAISGKMMINRKGNDKMTLQTAVINQTLSKTWGAGYYNPTISIPKNMGFSCEKPNLLNGK